MGQIRVHTEWEDTEWDAQGVEYRVGYTHGVEYEVGYLHEVGDKGIGDS